MEAYFKKRADFNEYRNFLYQILPDGQKTCDEIIELINNKFGHKTVCRSNLVRKLELRFSDPYVVVKSRELKKKVIKRIEM